MNFLNFLNFLKRRKIVHDILWNIIILRPQGYKRNMEVMNKKISIKTGKLLLPHLFSLYIEITWGWNDWTRQTRPRIFPQNLISSQPSSFFKFPISVSQSITKPRPTNKNMKKVLLKQSWYLKPHKHETLNKKSIKI